VTAFTMKSFSVSMGKNRAYAENWDKVFGKKKEEGTPSTPLVSLTHLEEAAARARAALTPAEEKVFQTRFKDLGKERLIPRSPTSIPDGDIQRTNFPSSAHVEGETDWAMQAIAKLEPFYLIPNITAHDRTAIAAILRELAGK